MNRHLQIDVKHKSKLKEALEKAEKHDGKITHHLKPDPAKVEKYPPTAKKQIDFNNQLVKVYAKHYYPINYVEQEELRTLISICDPKISWPSRKTFAQKHIPRVFEKSEQKLKDDMEKTAKHIHFTTDMWTSK